MSATVDCSTKKAKMAASVTRAIAILSAHPSFQHRLQHFSFVQDDDVLIIEGMAPSFYLKQLLQATLKRLDEVRRIDNRVRVVSCVSLSSVPAEQQDHSEFRSTP